MPARPVLSPETLRWLPWVVAIAFFMQSLDGTILNTALPDMASDLKENPLRMQGVIVAYMLTVALLIPATRRPASYWSNCRSRPWPCR